MMFAFQQLASDLRAFMLHDVNSMSEDDIHAMSDDDIRELLERTYDLMQDLLKYRKYLANSLSKRYIDRIFNKL